MPLKTKGLIKFVMGTLVLTMLWLSGKDKVFAAESVAITEDNFPDVNFRQYILDEIDMDKNQILSEAEIAETQVINVQIDPNWGDEAKKISNLKGIEYFTALRYLTCSFNKLSTLDVSNNTQLISLDCVANQIHSLKLNTALENLYCGSNQLESLDLTQCENLRRLECYGNQLNTLDIGSNSLLIYLDCKNNRLNSLDTSNNVSLVNVECSDNQLTEIDINVTLKTLYCNNNQLTDLNFSNAMNLEELYCNDNQLVNLKANKNIRNLSFANNFVKKINSDEYVSLRMLNCSNNEIESLDVSKHSELEILHCENNQLQNLDVSNNTALKYLECGYNFLSCLDLSKNQILYNESLGLHVFGGYGNAIAVGEKQIDMRLYDEKFDASKVAELENLKLENNVFTLSEGCNSGSYVYDCGFGFLMPITIYMPEGENIPIDEIHFPDAGFRKYVLTNIDKDKDGVLSVVENGRTNRMSIDLVEISDLKGIEYFTYLEELSCPNIKLKNLDVSQNTALRVLSCPDNEIEYLDLSNNIALESLLCANNQLKSLDLSNNVALNYLNCCTNLLSVLDVSNNVALKQLMFVDNQLKSIDLSNNKNLVSLECANNQLRSLDVRNVTGLKTLECSNNNIGCLDISKNNQIEYFYASNNYINIAVNQIDMLRYDEKFDVSKVSNLNDLILDNNTFVISGENVSGTYEYVCGNDKTMTVTINMVAGAYEDVDVLPGNWKYESIKYVAEKGIMGGVGGSNQFMPDNSLTRAMFATVLYRMAGEPEVIFGNKFADVEVGKWYSDAIVWANQNGIVNGYSDGNYGINDNITREQIAKMLYLYGECEGYDVSGSASLDTYTDVDAVSGWAIGYMKWAVDTGMITGKPNGDGTFRLDPKGDATRAECAKMLAMFMKKY